MAKREIKHRLGKIEYEYNDEVTWTKVDQQMADGLAHCLLTSEKIIEEVNALLKQSMEISKGVDQGNKTFKNVGALLKEAQIVAGGYIGAIELGQLSIADKLVEATNLANDALQEQNKALTEVHATYSVVLDAHNKLVEADEEAKEKVYDQLTKLFALGYETENLATDLTSFDRAEDRVRELLSFNDRTQERLLNAVLNTTRDFELLLAKVEGQQNVWTEFCSGLILIEYIGKLRSGNQSTSVN